MKSYKKYLYTTKLFSKSYGDVSVLKLLIIIPFCAYSLFADTLTVSKAIRVGLKNNFGIIISKNNLRKADNTRKLKIGSVLPLVSVNAGTKYSTSSNSSAPMSADDWEYTVGTSLNWTLFDGFKMFYGLKQVENNAVMSEFVARNNIELSVLQIYTNFYTYALALNMLKIARYQLSLSKKQLEIYREKSNLGSISNLDFMRYEVIINSDSSNILSKKLDVLNSLNELNSSLGRNPEDSLNIVPDTSVLPPAYNLDFWYENAMKNNHGIKISKMKENISKTNLSIAKSTFWPTITMNGVYTGYLGDNNYTRTSAGINLVWPLISGFQRVTNVQNSAIDLKNSEITYRQDIRDLKNVIYQQYTTMLNNWEKIKFERRAVDLALKSFELSKEQFILGSISDIKLRDTQLSLLEAETRLYSSVFQYQVSQKRLEQLAGLLRIE